MSKTYNWLVYHAIKKKFQFEYVKFIDEENYIIDYENSTPSNEGSFLTSNNSKFRKVENFISVVFFIILFGPLRVFFSTFVTIVFLRNLKYSDSCSLSMVYFNFWKSIIAQICQFYSFSIFLDLNEEVELGS